MKLIIATFLAAHARDTDMTVLDLATHEDWIVCLGETRTVRSGQITCPLRPGRPTTRGECAACRHLEWQHDERRNGEACSADGEPPVR